ncbi:hypothetical protein EC991_005685 [Linnemannia zychae]|nr:hypothetical protein EC991_005685 [Linnemannia zychae]
MPSQPSKTQNQQQQQQQSSIPVLSAHKNAAHGANAQAQSNKAGSAAHGNNQQQSSFTQDRAQANKQHHGSQKKSSGSHPLKIDSQQQSTSHH